MISGLRRLTNDTDQLQNVRAVDGNTAPTAPKEVAVLLGLSGTEVLNRAPENLVTNLVRLAGRSVRSERVLFPTCQVRVFRF
jgi:hypothetical protein